MDVIGRDDPPLRARPRRPVDRLAALVGAAALVTTAAGAVAAQRVDDGAGPAPGQVGVVFDGGEAEPAGEGARGVLQLLVVNRSADPVEVTGLALVAGGLDVLAVQPVGQPALGPFGQRRYVLRYVVADCGQLRLPGAVRLTVAAPGGAVAERSVPLATPTQAGDGVPFGPCPESGAGAGQAGAGSSGEAGTAAGAGLSARTVGGSARGVGDGARGQAVVEVRNDGPSVLLLGVTAEVPGVRFTPVEPANGVPLRRGRRVELQLDFAVADCGRLRRTGRLVVRTSSGGVAAETGLPITHDEEARTLRRADLDVVLRACSR